MFLNKKYIILFLTVLFLFAACNKKKQQNVDSDKVLPKDKMVSLLVDFYIAESVLAQLSLAKKDDISEYTKNYYSLILQKYDSDTLKISNSIKYYSNNINSFKEITTEALDSLIILEAKVLND